MMRESGTVAWLRVEILATINTLKGFIQSGHTLGYFMLKCELKSISLLGLIFPHSFLYVTFFEYVNKNDYGYHTGVIFFLNF
jgi:hypothetical protein